MSDSDLLESLRGEAVILDVSSPFVYVGTLAGYDHRYIELTEADAHDLRDTSTTREKYVLEAAMYGVQSNRARVLVRREEIVSLSRLEDVVT